MADSRYWNLVPKKLHLRCLIGLRRTLFSLFAYRFVFMKISKIANSKLKTDTISSLKRISSHKIFLQQFVWFLWMVFVVIMIWKPVSLYFCSFQVAWSAGNILFVTVGTDIRKDADYLGNVSNKVLYLTLSWRRPLSYSNQSTDLRSKSMDWFLCDNSLRHERVKQSEEEFLKILDSLQSCKLWNNKHMIASTQITNTEIFAFITVLIFKLLNRRVLLTNREDNRNC